MATAGRDFRRARVTVNSVSEEPPSPESRFNVDTGQHFVVNVEYCAAEEEDAVDPEHFRMLYGEPTQLAHVDEAVEDRLEARELSVGQCATGNLRFFAAGDDISNLKVDYRPGDL